MDAQRTEALFREPQSAQSTVLEIKSVDFLLALVEHEQWRIIRQKAYPARPVTSLGYILQIEHAFNLAAGDTHTDHFR